MLIYIVLRLKNTEIGNKINIKFSKKKKKNLKIKKKEFNYKQFKNK